MEVNELGNQPEQQIQFWIADFKNRIKGWTKADLNRYMMGACLEVCWGRTSDEINLLTNASATCRSILDHEPSKIYDALAYNLGKQAGVVLPDYNNL